MVMKTESSAGCLPDHGTPRQFTSLEEIELYKEEVRKSIQDDEKNISKLWSNLFHKEERHLPKTPVQRLSGMVNIGSGVIDGVILGWKLYRKFKGGRR